MNYWIVNEEFPEHAIGYDEEIIRLLFTDNGLKIIEPIHYGGWCGRKPHLPYQDICVVTKLTN
jgi:hypothetical protein